MMIQLSQLRARFAGLGARPVHVSYLLRLWTRGLAFDAGPRRLDAFLPLPLRTALPELVAELDAIAVLDSLHPATDGGTRLLLRLHDGQRIEGVLLPRDGVCVSTQIGCAVGCRFCMTGQGGLLRQVGSAEIVAQMVLARRRQRIRRVVFMGMGEPAHNLDAVLDAIQLLGTDGGIGHKDLVFSTVGDPRAFARLPDGVVRPALALSLHTTDPDLRAKLLPHAPRLSPAELVAAGEAYAQLTGYPVQYQWTLLEGVNDSDAELDGIVALLSGKHGIVNFIPYNRVDGLPYARPSWERAARMANHLNRRGILTRLRRSTGQDVDAGCGQLRARGA